MRSYIYTLRDGVHIFDLVKTQEGLRQACEFVQELGKQGKTLLIVGTKRQAQAIVKEEAQKWGAFYVSERWLGGTITNWEEIKRRLKMLTEMKEKKERGDYAKYTKKENLLIDREIAKLERFFGGLTGLEDTPDAMLIVDTHKEKAAFREAVAKGVEVIGMVDTNADPTGVTHVIAVNDDAVRSVKLVVSKVAEAYAAGKSKFKKQNAKQQVKA